MILMNCMMNFGKGFMYRRLARFAPVHFANVPCDGISLPDKHHVAGFAEVFLQPHYWRLFEMLETPPRIVFDLGANCGYFAVLCEILCRQKFSWEGCQYHSFEALEENIPRIWHSLKTGGIAGRSHIVQGAIGKNCGDARLVRHPKSTLTASVYPNVSKQERLRPP